MEKAMAIVLTDTKNRVELAKTLEPRKLYDQDKLNRLAKEYNKKQ